MAENIKKFGKQKLGVHGQDLPLFASDQSKAADARLKMTIDQHAFLKTALQANNSDRTTQTINWWQQRGPD
jgi:hypothetical protein